MLDFKILELEVSCSLSNTGTKLSLMNKAQPSAISSNLQQNLSCDILHESLCQTRFLMWNRSLCYVHYHHLWPISRIILGKMYYVYAYNCAFISTVRYFLSRKIRDKKRITDIGKYSFVISTIKHWNQIPAEALRTFPCKPKIFRNRVGKQL